MIEKDIRLLLDAPAAGEDAPTLAHLEETLTTGYARALALEAEQWRLQRRISEVATRLADGGDVLRASELKKLAEKLKSADEELSELRALLGSLRERAAEVRA